MDSKLFSPCRIGTLQIPNRFVRSATWEGMCTEDGRPTTRLADYYGRLVEGGAGLIISGYTFVRADGKQLPGKMGIHQDSLITPLKTLTQTVHSRGGVIFCQLVHAGGQTTSAMIGRQPLAPSAVKSPNFPEPPQELSRSDIRALTEAFADGARRARDAGFDGVQLHGAHGYLINQFLSPLTNRRSDEYGGSLENRQRFLLEVLEAVRTQVGQDYPVTIKLTACDHLEGGFALDEAVAVAKELEEGGIDAIEVSSGTAASGNLSPVRTGISTEEAEAYNAGFARAVKQAVSVPVMTVGGLRSLPVLGSCIESGQADFVSLARPLIREPELVNRWRRGDENKATCISCNGCFRPGLKEGGIYCVVDRKEAADE